MTYEATPVSPGTRGFDCITVLTESSAAALRAAGMSFAVRYLGGLSATEAQAILAGGLMLSVVTYSKAPGWLASAALGTSEGQTDLVYLTQAGIVHGVTAWIDLEGCVSNAADTAAWATARAKVLSNAGYTVGLYVGAGQPMNGQELFELPYITHYWQSCSSGVPEPTCGFCMRQLYPPNTTVAGVNTDLDYTQSDFHKRVPIMMTNSV